MIPWAHRSLQPERHLDQFSRFGTAHRRVSLYFTMGRHSPKLFLPLGWSGSPSNKWFPWSSQVGLITQTAFRSAQTFLQGWGLTNVTPWPDAHTQTPGPTTLSLDAMRPNDYNCSNNRILLYTTIGPTLCLKKENALACYNFDERFG